MNAQTWVLNIPTDAQIDLRVEQCNLVAQVREK